MYEEKNDDVKPKTPDAKEITKKGFGGIISKITSSPKLIAVVSIVAIAIIVGFVLIIILLTSDNGETPLADGNNSDITDNAPGNNDNSNDVNCEHSFCDWIATKQSTCKDEGELVRTCSKCSANEKATIAKINIHTEVIDSAISSTCKTNGKTEGKHCSVCGLVIVEQISLPLLGHTYDDENDEKCNICDLAREVECKHTKTEILSAIGPTCTESGLTTGIQCIDCHRIIVQQKTIPMLEHVFDRWTIIKNVTCTTDGVEMGFCSCGANKARQIVSSGHKYTSFTQLPTCTEQGYTTYNCACGDNYVDDYVNAVGHDYDYYVCKRCDDDQTTGKYLDFSVYGSYAVVEGLSKTVFGNYVSEEKNIIIPATFNGLPVKKIDSHAFGGCDFLTSITIPATLEIIGMDAFSNCTSLKKVVFANNSQLKTIEKDAFFAARAEDVFITDIDAWCNTIFEGVAANPFGNASALWLNDEKVTNVILPDGITDIGLAFSNCDSITSIYIPQSVATVPEYAFYDCDNLANIIVNDANTVYKSIDGNLYMMNEDNLTLTLIQYSIGKNDSEFTISSDVTAIEKLAFYNCQNLESINFADQNNWKLINTAGNVWAETINLSNGSVNSYMLTDIYSNMYWCKE